MKYEVFDGYIISYALYKKNGEFIWIYNYDRIYSLIFFYMLKILNTKILKKLNSKILKKINSKILKKYNFISINNAPIGKNDFNNLTDNYFIICSFIYNKKQYYNIIDINSNKKLIDTINNTDNDIHYNIDNNIDNKIDNKYDYNINKFLYVVLNDKYDITSKFEKFQKYILYNKYLNTFDIINIIKNFFNIKFFISEKLEIKLMIYESLDEIIFKEKELLII